LKNVKRTFLYVAVVTVAFVFAASAFAGGSTLKGYGGVGGNVSNKVGTPSTKSGSTGTLPFTGLDLTLVCLGGALLVTTGFVVRRAAAANRS
jgi:hypothetical protein